MKILHVVFCLNVGGLEMFVLDLARHSADRQDSVIACLTGEGALSPLYEGEVHYLHKKDGVDFAIFKRLYRLIKTVKPDLIHAHNQAAGLYASVAGFLAGTPVLYTKHGRHDGKHSARRFPLERLFHPMVRKMVCVSDDLRQMCIARMKLPLSKVSVVLNGIDTERFVPRSHQPGEGTEVKSCLIGCVARLVPEKDHLTLLKACRILKENGCHVKLLLVGEGPCREAIEDEVTSSGLEGSVELLGVRHDVTDLLPRFDIFALSSVTEGISLTLLEAMSCALPVVTTRVGGNPEVVAEGETGLLVPPGDPEALARALLLLMEDQALRRRMGGRGRERVLELFSLCKSASEYGALYCSLVNR